MAIPLIKTFDQFNESLNQPILESASTIVTRQNSTSSNQYELASWDIKINSEKIGDNDQTNYQKLLEALGADPTFQAWWAENTSLSAQLGNGSLPNWAYMPFMETIKHDRKGWLNKVGIGQRVIHTVVHILAFGKPKSELEFMANFKVKSPSVGGANWPFICSFKVGNGDAHELMAWPWDALNSLTGAYLIRLADYVDGFKKFGITQTTAGLTEDTKGLKGLVRLSPEIWFRITGETDKDKTVPDFILTDKSGAATTPTTGGQTTTPAQGSGTSTPGQGNTAPGQGNSGQGVPAGSTDYTGLKLSNPPVFNKLVKELQLRMQWLGGRAEANINGHGGADGKYGQFTAHAIGVLINGAQGGQDVNEITKEISDKLNTILAKYPPTTKIKNLNGEGTKTIADESIENDEYFSNKPETLPGNGFTKTGAHGAGAGGTAAKPGQASPTPKFQGNGGLANGLKYQPVTIQTQNNKPATINF